MHSKILDNILNNSTGEREVAAYLGENPDILRWTVCKTGGHCTYVLKEFPFGSRYKADFVVVTCYSGAWEVHLIELEPHDDMVITKAGTPSKRLSGAIAQINDWIEYIRQNEVSFKQDLSIWCIKKDLLKDCVTVKKPVNGTGNYLSEPETFIYFHYYIIIGNRNAVNDEKRRRMNQLSQYPLHIFTYGRVIDVARNFDRVAKGEERVRLTESEEEKV